MSKIKSKIVKWEYVTEPFDVLVLPALIKRVLSPIWRSLSPHYTNGEFYLHLRPCVKGVDEDGAVVKYLYCTRDGRFFVRGKEGWNEIKPDCCGNNPKKKGGSSDCPQFSKYGWKPAHRCVAFAWLDVPEEVKLQLAGEDVSTKWEVDHLNTDHKNWTADNLQWVTADENRRRGAIAKLMRTIGLDPKLLTPTLMRGICTLPTIKVIFCLNCFKGHCHHNCSPLSVEAIRLNFAKALDDVKNDGVYRFIATGIVTTRQEYQWLMKKIKEHKQSKTTKH